MKFELFTLITLIILIIFLSGCVLITESDKPNNGQEIDAPVKPSNMSVNDVQEFAENLNKSKSFTIRFELIDHTMNENVIINIKVNKTSEKMLSEVFGLGEEPEKTYLEGNELHQSDVDVYDIENTTFSEEYKVLSAKELTRSSLSFYNISFDSSYDINDDTVYRYESNYTINNNNRFFPSGSTGTSTVAVDEDRYIRYISLESSTHKLDVRVSDINSTVVNKPGWVKNNSSY
jgi:hypothetical protein